MTKDYDGIHRIYAVKISHDRRFEIRGSGDRSVRIRGRGLIGVWQSEGWEISVEAEEIADEEAQDLRLVTREEIEAAIREAGGTGRQHARAIPGGRYR
jgi:hypothetical protein